MQSVQGLRHDTLEQIKTYDPNLSSPKWLDIPMEGAKAATVVIDPQGQERRLYLKTHEPVGEGTFGRVWGVCELVTGNNNLVIKVPHFERKTSMTQEEWRQMAIDALLHEAEVIADIYSLEGVKDGQIIGLTPKPRMVCNFRDFKALIFDRFPLNCSKEISRRVKGNEPLCLGEKPDYTDIFYQIFHGLNVMAKHEYAMRDVRTSNIALNPEKRRYYLYDLGAAEKMDKMTDETHRPVMRYTTQYDKLAWYKIVKGNGKLEDYRILMKARDVFAAAASLYRLVMGTEDFPYTLDQKNEYALQLSRFEDQGLIKNGLDPRLISLLKRCLGMQYENRPTAEQVCEEINAIRP